MSTPADAYDDVADAHRVVDASLDKPSEGRVYDYYLGGNSSFQVDREFAKAAIARMPDIPYIARENRRFLYRAVSYLIGQGIRQFVDIGSGVPSRGNVHEIADREAPDECHVVYVDHDPVAWAHATLLLDKHRVRDRHRVIRSDLLTPGDTWQAVLDSGVIDPRQPIALLVVAVLHFVPPDQRPAQALDFYRERLAPGSFVVMSHATNEDMHGQQKDTFEGVRQSYDDNSTTRAHFRGREELKALFGGWPLVEPGIVWAPEWRDDGGLDGDPARAGVLAGMATKVDQ